MVYYYNIPTFPVLYTISLISLVVLSRCRIGYYWDIVGIIGCSLLYPNINKLIMEILEVEYNYE